MSIQHTMGGGGDTLGDKMSTCIQGHAVGTYTAGCGLVLNLIYFPGTEFWFGKVLVF